jgi:hypothetical protein
MQVENEILRRSETIGPVTDYLGLVIATFGL